MADMSGWEGRVERHEDGTLEVSVRIAPPDLPKASTIEAAKHMISESGHKAGDVSEAMGLGRASLQAAIRNQDDMGAMTLARVARACGWKLELVSPVGAGYEITSGEDGDEENESIASQPVPAPAPPEAEPLLPDAPREVVEAYRLHYDKGLSVRDACDKAGIYPSRFYRWVRRRERHPRQQG